MNCELARDWLLNAEAPAGWEAAPAAIAEHVRGCDGCRKLVADLLDLEECWRSRPLPERAEAAKAVFLDRLQQQSSPAPASRGEKPRRWAAARFWAVAVALLFVAGSAVLLFGPSQPVAAQSDVIDQLIDWNLDLSAAGSPADRQRIYSERKDGLQKSVGKARLDASDRGLAENLLANGSWLAENQDPVEELQRLNTMADQVLEQVKTSSDFDGARAGRFARQFRKINERGIDPAMERVRTIAAADPERRKLINRILKHDKDRAKQIDEILERSPDISKKELRKALDLAQKRHKHKKSE